MCCFSTLLLFCFNMMILLPRVLLVSKERRSVICIILHKVFIGYQQFVCVFVAPNLSIHGKQKVCLTEETTTKFGASIVLAGFTSGCKMVYYFFSLKLLLLHIMNLTLSSTQRTKLLSQTVYEFLWKSADAL